jgi:hypothetical protein
MRTPTVILASALALTATLVPEGVDAAGAAAVGSTTSQRAREDLLASLERLRDARAHQLQVARDAAAHRAAAGHRNGVAAARVLNGALLSEAQHVSVRRNNVDDDNDGAADHDQSSMSDAHKAAFVRALQRLSPEQRELLRHLTPEQLSSIDPAVAQVALGTNAQFGGKIGGMLKKGAEFLKGLFGGGGGGGGGGGDAPGENEFTKELEQKEQQLQGDVDSDISKKLAKVKELMALLKSLFDMFGKGSSGSGSGGGGGGGEGAEGAEEAQRRAEEQRRLEEEERRKAEEEALAAEREGATDPLAAEARRAEEEEARRNLEEANRAEREAELEAQRLEAQMRAEDAKHRRSLESETASEDAEAKATRDRELAAERAAQLAARRAREAATNTDGLGALHADAAKARAKAEADKLSAAERRAAALRAEEEATAKYKAQRDADAAKLAKERARWAAEEEAERKRLAAMARKSKGRHGADCHKDHVCDVGPWAHVHELLDGHKLYASAVLQDGCTKDKFSPHESPMDNLDDAADGHKAHIPHHHSSEGGAMCLDPRLAKLVLAVADHGVPEITAFHGEHHHCADGGKASMAVVFGSLDDHPLDAEHRETALKVIEACEAAGASEVFNANRDCGCECKKYHHSVLCAL